MALFAYVISKVTKKSLETGQLIQDTFWSPTAKQLETPPNVGQSRLFTSSSASSVGRCTASGPAMGDRKYWDDLLTWASGFKGFECNITWTEVEGAGRGLVATSSKKAEEPLLIVPAPALLNPLTLLSSPNNTIPPHLFPHSTRLHISKRRRTSKEGNASGASISRLNTTQLLTLHLALTRDPHARHPSGWGVYLDTIPRSFRPWHPLTWVVGPQTPPESSKAGPGPPTQANGKNARKSLPRKPVDSATAVTDGSDEWRRWNNLMNHVPSSARENILRVKERFDADLLVLQRVLGDEEPFKSQDLLSTLSTNDLLWAWLNVNTRSVSLNLGYPGPTELYNHTLVPLLDLVNHSSAPELCIPKPRQIPSIPTLTHSKPNLHNPTPHLIPGRIGFGLYSPERGLLQGEELRFEYHGHPNSELWAEYGFAERPAAVDGWKGMRYSQVDVGRLIDKLWEKVGADMKAKQEVLEQIGCWGQNTIHAHPVYEPSHGLLMTLRVLQLDSKSSDKLKPISQGTVTYISEENEKAVNVSLRMICQEVLDQVKIATKELDILEKEPRGDEDGDQDYSDAIRTIRVLWDEQRDIAEGCLKSYLS